MKNQPRRDKKNFSKKPRGFFLIEVLVSVVLFSIVMIVAMSVFVNTITIKKRVKASEMTLEDARFVLETMAKNLRGSKLIDGSETFLETFDYSQGRCIRYEFFPAEGMVKSGIGIRGADNACDFSGVQMRNMINEKNTIENMSFYVVKPILTPSVEVGRVTISMKICSLYEKNICSEGSDKFSIQTTVSFRNLITEIAG